MDGMPIQTEWQLKSGRSEHAWWREANSTLTVDQFRALQSRGEFANIELQTPDGKYNPPPLSEDLRQKNLAYWDHVDRISNEGTPPTQANVDSLQRTLWNWHEPAIHAGLRRADKDLNSLPPAERRFAQAWGESMVDYLAKGNFPTNGENIKTINEKFLPSRIVRPEDYGTKPTDLGPLQQRTVQALDAFHTIDKLGLNHLIGSNAAGVAGSIPWSRGKLLEMLDAAVKNPDQAEAIMEDIGQKVDRVRDLVPQFPDLEWPDWLRIPGVTPPSTTLSR